MHKHPPDPSSSLEHELYPRNNTTSEIKSKRECAVCEDTAISKHYGATTCNGCKGFFRRSILENRVYSCRLRQACVVMKDQRNECRACRMEKCLSVGMNPKAVQGAFDDTCPNNPNLVSLDLYPYKKQVACQTERNCWISSTSSTSFQTLPTFFMTLGKSRFTVFYWWLLCCWTAKCGSSGVCYSNGSYFPLNTNFQPIPDLKGITELAIETVSKPLARLCLTEAEILIGSVLAVFFEYPLPPKMSHGSTQILDNARDHYIECMSSCSEDQSSLRLAEISLIFSSITNLVHLTSDSIEVLDAMQVLAIDQLFRDVFIVKP